jgi:hypothetical protein
MERPAVSRNTFAVAAGDPTKIASFGGTRRIGSNGAESAKARGRNQHRHQIVPGEEMK